MRRYSAGTSAPGLGLSEISLLLAYFSSYSDTEVSKRSTIGMPALAKAVMASSEAPWVTLRPDPSDSSLPV
jgi:hypothetical protein